MSPNGASQPVSFPQGRPVDNPNMSAPVVFPGQQPKQQASQQPKGPTSRGRNRAQSQAIKTGAIQRNALKEATRIAMKEGRDRYTQSDLDLGTQIVENRIGRKLLSPEKPSFKEGDSVSSGREFYARTAHRTPDIAPVRSPMPEVAIQRTALAQDRLNAIRRFGFKTFMQSPMGRRMTDGELEELVTFAKMNGMDLPINSVVKPMNLPALPGVTPTPGMMTLE
jgi:hypothetical protein